jgi:hypothetical protein
MLTSVMFSQVAEEPTKKITCGRNEFVWLCVLPNHYCISQSQDGVGKFGVCSDSPRGLESNTSVAVQGRVS